MTHRAKQAADLAGSSARPTPTGQAGDSGAWPAAAGFRWPAEWEPHQATWLSWPHNRDTWPGVFDSVEPVMAAAAAALSHGEAVRINVLDRDHEAHVRRLLPPEARLDRIFFHPLPTNDAWIRDHGAIFVRRPADGMLAAVDCDYNAWGGKYPPYDDDARAARRMAETLGVACYPGRMVLEGGAIDGNGAGALLTTESCLLNPNRNPGMSRAAIEARLRMLFGVEQILWLGDGIVGDDTDGHVDDITRFVDRATVVTAVEPDPADANHRPLRQNRERLARMCLSDGTPMNVIELPMPPAVYHGDQRLPASYANFYVANRVVLMPAYGDPADERAAAVLADCFPGREVVALDCRRLVAGLGAFHCLTQQVPAADGAGVSAGRRD